jgi:hypothetical protein
MSSERTKSGLGLNAYIASFGSPAAYCAQRRDRMRKWESEGKERSLRPVVGWRVSLGGTVHGG